MRFEAKTEADAVEQAARALGRSTADVSYRVIRDEKSFWGGRIVEIEVEAPAGAAPMASEASETAIAVEQTALDQPPAALEREEKAAAADRSRRSDEPVLDEEAFAAVESTLSELLSTAGFLLETRRQSSREEMVIELIGDDVEPLLANKGEGLNGLEILTGRIASRRLGRPVHPRLDAEGFRAHQRESLEELAQRSAEEVKRTRHPQLLPPLSPGERRLVHLALAEDPEVETESEGDGFLKRVAVKLKAR
ncbi:MAG TPA: R3H domain-containing nucleic acid-binding protein [Thermoanaerobaculia bacterium]|nr:R3H domain-containing nucleic acid-binding protein [Thermoanaerobaculia bacterium]